MALNSSGPISLAGTTAGQSIELENGGNGTTQISLNDAAVRTLAGVPSGAITMPTNFYGKSNRVAVSYTFSANTANASLNLSALGGYSAGKTDFTVTVNSGVYLYATSTANYGLNLTGATTGDTVTLVNNGYIMGMGGAGGGFYGDQSPAYKNGNNGGPALNVGIGTNITINNTNASAYIGGGGGGGAQGYGGPSAGGGGGAGGGKAGDWWDSYATTTKGGTYYTYVYYSYGGAGGGVGASGSQGTAGYTTNYASGGGGGRIFPGTGGAAVTYIGGSNNLAKGNGGGAGGGGGAYANGKGQPNVTSGAGGSGNAAAVSKLGGASSFPGVGGGGWGAAGGNSGMNSTYYTFGGSGGKAVNLNGKTVTWTSSDTARVYGTVS